MNFEWLSGVLVGVIAISLFAWSEFDQPTFERQEDRPETNFAPQELTTHRDYLRSFILYWVGLEIIYLLVCIIGPRPFVEDSDARWFESAASVPLWAALVIVGILPRVPLLAFVEQGWRRLMHEWASIPQAVLSLSRELRRSEYDLGRFRDLVRESREDYATFVTASDFDADRRTVSYRWARLSAIICELEDIETGSAAEEYVDFGFIERHRPDLDAIRDRYRHLAEDIQRSRSPSPELPSGLVEAPAGFRGLSTQPDEPGHDGPTPERAVPNRFSPEVDDLLERVSMFLACALIAKTSSRSSLSSAMRMFGFISSIKIEQSSDIDVVLKGFANALLGFLIFVCIATFLSNALPQSIVQNAWPKTTEVFTLTLSVFLMHGTAVLAALLTRRHFRLRQRWLGGTVASLEMPNAIKYAGLIAVSYAFTLPVVLYWYFGFLTGNDLWTAIGNIFPVVLIGCVSAFFVCYIIDSAYVRRSNFTQWRIVTLQMAVTMLLAFSANVHFFRANVEEFWGAILFATLSAGLIALVLGTSTAALMKPSRQASPTDGAREALLQP